MKDFTMLQDCKPAPRAQPDVLALVSWLESLSMVAGLEVTEDAAPFLSLCAGQRAEAYRIVPLAKAGLVTQEGVLTAQGIAVRSWLGL